MKNIFHFYWAILLGALFLTPPIWGRYKMGVDKPEKVEPSYRQAVTNENVSSKMATPGKQEFNEKPILKTLSDKYQVAVDQLEYYRERKYGYEELVPALIIGRVGGIQVGSILAARDRGNSWKQIADSYSINLKPLNKLVQDELKPIKDVLPKEYLEERPSFLNNGQ